MADSRDPTEVWRALFPTDPKYVKPIPARPGLPGGLLSSIDPMWRMMRLTEYFGPYGQGWGIEEEPKPLVIDAGEQTLLFMCLKCFWVHPETKEKFIIYGFGGDSITKKKVGSSSSGDDEALKKCVTDALMNAYMRLGLSADIWLNLHKDVKYLAEVREHYENSRAIQEQMSQQPRRIEDTK